jgi:chromosome segregation ATPase
MVVIAFLFLRSCNLYDQNSILKGRYDTLKKIADADHALLTTEIGQLTNDIGLRDKEIARLTESITVINTALDGKDRDLAALRASWSNLSAECQARLHELDAAWVEKELLYKQEISAERGVTEQWVIKYNNAIKIGEDWKRMYENENALRLLAEKRIGKLEGSLRWSRLFRTGTTVLAIVGGGYVALDLLRGK